MFRLKAIIYEFVPLQDFELDPNSINTEKIAAKQQFRNAGPSTIKRTYKAEKTFEQTSQFEFSNSKRNLYTWSVEISHTVKFGGGIPGIGVSEMETTLKAGFQNENEETNTNTQSNSTREAKTFSIEEDVELLPCTETEVSSFVQIASDVQVDYKVYYNVSGWVGEKHKKMTAVEVKNRLVDMKYVRDEGEYHVIAEGTAKFKTTYGLKAFLNSTGNRIPDCDFGEESDSTFFGLKSLPTEFKYGAFIILLIIGFILGVFIYKKYWAHASTSSQRQPKNTVGDQVDAEIEYLETKT